ncbi:MAG: hypothetical protein IJ608_12610 [Lachnospiraceae bacterium]|nr:hypothetical protein [Lachnospiraceae bacterium]
MGGRLNIPPHVAMLTRLLVGLYLLYADYSVFDDMLLMEGTKRFLLIAVMIIFAAAGILLIVTSAIGLYRWKFGDKKDKQNMDNENGGA